MHFVISQPLCYCILVLVSFHPSLIFRTASSLAHIVYRDHKHIKYPTLPSGICYLRCTSCLCIRICFSIYLLHNIFAACFSIAELELVIFFIFATGFMFPLPLFMLFCLSFYSLFPWLYISQTFDVTKSIILPVSAVITNPMPKFV